MTTIVCRSAFVAAELALMTGQDNAIVYTGASSHGQSPESWLSLLLERNSVSVVFYEPSFFIDPAPYRTISPETVFVVLAGPGEEETAREAMVRGACAVIGKPLNSQDVSGVLSLVSR